MTKSVTTTAMSADNRSDKNSGTTTSKVFAEVEELVRSDPSISYSICIWPVLQFFWTNQICKKIHPLFLLAIYIGIITIWYSTSSLLVRRVFFLVGTLPILGSILFMGLCIYMFKHFRKKPFPEAQDILLERILDGRAGRNNNAYDVFLPPPNIKQQRQESPLCGNKENDNNHKQVGLIFFPGALVNHTSYAPIAAALSDRGILVAVLSLEPLRIIADMETNRKLALEAMKEIERTNIGVEEWVLAGHSAGGMTALNLAAAADDDLPLHIHKLVVCGVGSNEMIGRGQNLCDKPIDIMIINGTEDGIIKSLTDTQKEEFCNFLPPEEDGNGNNNKNLIGRTTRVNIEGGNHSGFAHYEGQLMDGNRTISREEQQRIFVETMADFVLEQTSMDAANKKKDE